MGGYDSDLEWQPLGGEEDFCDERDKHLISIMVEEEELHQKGSIPSPTKKRKKRC